MIVWTYYDIRARSADLYVHIFATALVLVFNVFGLLLYFILRPRETLAEAYERSLEEESLLQELEDRLHCRVVGNGSIPTTWCVQAAT